MQKGRINFVRFMRMPGSEHFFLVNEAVAGSKQAAWDIAIKLATMLDTGAIKEDQLVAERAKLCTVIT